MGYNGFLRNVSQWVRGNLKLYGGRAILSSFAFTRGDIVFVFVGTTTIFVRGAIGQRGTRVITNIIVLFNKITGSRGRPVVDKFFLRGRFVAGGCFGVLCLFVRTGGA